MSVQSQIWVNHQKNKELSSNARRVLAELGKRANDAGEIFVSQYTIADSLCCSLRSVQRGYKELIDHNLIVKTKRWISNKRTTNFTCLNYSIDFPYQGCAVIGLDQGLVADSLYQNRKNVLYHPDKIMHKLAPTQNDIFNRYHHEVYKNHSNVNFVVDHFHSIAIAKIINVALGNKLDINKIKASRHEKQTLLDNINNIFIYNIVVKNTKRKERANFYKKMDILNGKLPTDRDLDILRTYDQYKMFRMSPFPDIERKQTERYNMIIEEKRRNHAQKIENDRGVDPYAHLPVFRSGCRGENKTPTDSQKALASQSLSEIRKALEANRIKS